MVTNDFAKIVADEVVKDLSPLSVMMFGSVARDGKGEDIDLLVLIDDHYASGLKDLECSLYRSLKPFYSQCDIDTFLITKSNFMDHYRCKSPFLEAVLRDGKVLYMRDITSEWRKNAMDEYETATYLKQGFYYRAACYHAQQSIEKSIKAALLAKGWQLQKIHSIARLMSECETFSINLLLSDEEISFIDSIYRGLYSAEVGLLPGGDPSSADAEQAVALASRLVSN